MSRELLKEAARELGAVQYYIPPADETVEMTPAITADVDACQRLAERIDAYLAEPLDSAIEDLIDEIRDNDHMPDTDRGDFNFTLSYKEAAALIVDYGHRVPRAFVEEIYRAGYSTGYVQPTTRNRDKEIAAIAAKHGVKLEDAK